MKIVESWGTVSKPPIWTNEDSLFTLGVQQRPLNSHSLLEKVPIVSVGIYFINNSTGLFFLMVVSLTSRVNFMHLSILKLRWIWSHNENMGRFVKKRRNACPLPVECRSFLVQPTTSAAQVRPGACTQAESPQRRRGTAESHWVEAPKDRSLR